VQRVKRYGEFPPVRIEEWRDIINIYKFQTIKLDFGTRGMVGIYSRYLSIFDLLDHDSVIERAELYDTGIGCGLAGSLYSGPGSAKINKTRSTALERKNDKAEMSEIQYTGNNALL
jgi:hypothetical protein